MTVTVASGKGGAGKTSVSAALASWLGASCVVADCDVDAANGAIALGAMLRVSEPYFGGPGFSIDPGSCTACGNCLPACRFGALRTPDGSSVPHIIPELCERCGACLDRCSAGAIVMRETEAGRLYVSDTRLGSVLVHAELVPGEDTSGKLVRKVRVRADSLASPGSVIVVDAPPGIGCPVIASLAGSDLVVLVLEAGASGIRDALRLVALLDSMGRIPGTVAVINKTGLDPGSDGLARKVLAEAGIRVAGEIPFDPGLRSVEESGRTWADLPGPAGDRVRSALSEVKAAIDSRPGTAPGRQSEKELT